MATRLAEGPANASVYVKKAVRDGIDMKLADGLDMEKRLSSIVQSR